MSRRKSVVGFFDSPGIIGDVEYRAVWPLREIGWTEAHTRRLKLLPPESKY
jgi:hypothetical protein